MNRSIRNWFRNVEETLALSVAATGILLIIQPLFWENGIPVSIAGFILMIVQGICTLSLSIQSLQLISINVMFGGTRKDALKAMHLTMLAGLVQIELVQVILCFVPILNSDLQHVAVCYTPVFFLCGNGLAFMITWLQFKHEKAHKVIFTIFCILIGMIMGMMGAMSGDMIESIGGRDIRNALDGVVFVASILISAAIYVAGSLVHSRGIRNMDVRI